VTGLPRWARPTQVGEATTLLVTVSGPGGFAESRRVATAAYVWARQCGAPVPDIGRVCRFGRDVVVPFCEELSGELIEKFSADIVEMYATGSDTALLGANTTGAEVTSVQAI